MAENKKSAIIYTDWITIFEELEDDEAGQLIKHLFRYINDKEPEPPSRLIKIIFEPIKQTLKRDLKAWEGTREYRVESGKLGGIASGEARRLKKENEANEASASKTKQTKQSQANEAVIVSVSDSVIVNEEELKRIELGRKREEVKQKLIAAVAAASERKKIFYHSLVPFLEMYSKEMIKAFYDYWNELNKNQTQMRFEKEPTWELSKRLATWSRREKPNKSEPQKTVTVPYS